jgi:hypothetical protein
LVLAAQVNNLPDQVVEIVYFLPLHLRAVGVAALQMLLLLLLALAVQGVVQEIILAQVLPVMEIHQALLQAKVTMVVHLGLALLIMEPEVVAGHLLWAQPELAQLVVMVEQEPHPQYLDHP